MKLGNSFPGLSHIVRNQDSFLPKQQAQLCRNFLNVAHVVKE